MNNKKFYYFLKRGISVLCTMAAAWYVFLCLVGIILFRHSAVEPDVACQRIKEFGVLFILFSLAAFGWSWWADMSKP